MLKRLSMLHGGPRFYLASALVSLWWAYVILIGNPSQLSEVNAFHELAAVAPGPVWGIFCLVLGAVQFSAAVVTFPRVLAVAGIVGAMWWGTVYVIFLQVPHITTASGTYLIIAVFNMWGALFFWRLRCI